MDSIAIIGINVGIIGMLFGVLFITIKKDNENQLKKLSSLEDQNNKFRGLIKALISCVISHSNSVRVSEAAICRLIDKGPIKKEMKNRLYSELNDYAIDKERCLQQLKLFSPEKSERTTAYQQLAELGNSSTVSFLRQLRLEDEEAIVVENLIEHISGRINGY